MQLAYINLYLVTFKNVIFASMFGSQNEYKPFRKIVDLSVFKKFYSKHVGSVYSICSIYVLG